MKNLQALNSKLTSVKLLITGTIYAFLYFMPLFGYDHRLTDRGLILVSAGFAGIIWMFVDGYFIRRELEKAIKNTESTNGKQ